MIDKCERCGERAHNYFMRTAVDAQGQKVTVQLCKDCYFGCKNVSRITVEGKGTVSLLPIEEADKIEQEAEVLRTGGGWTSVLKVICIINTVIMTIIGFVLGGKIADIIPYSKDLDIVVGVFLGGIIGFAVGIILIAFVMVICEMSTTLKEILIELKKKK